MTHSPAQLPLAPRPVSTELLSSWLLRVAAANLTSLRELLNGFEMHYGRILTNAPIDYGISETAVKALSRFCRVPPGAIRMLDIREQAPSLTPCMLLRFKNVSFQCHRYCSERVRYTFCPTCLGDQRSIHIPWDWSVSHLGRCAIHRRSLVDGCPACGEADPLAFDIEDLRCRSCGAILLHDMDDRDHDFQVVEDAYRSALTGTAPVMLKATYLEFRRFVEEMSGFLTAVLDPSSGRPNGADLFSRRDILDIIAVLVLNAGCSSTESVRRQRGRQRLRLWATLLSVIPEYRGVILQTMSLRWPIALRKGFMSGLQHRYRKRWPHTPYRPATQLGKPVLRTEIAGVFGLI